MKVNGIIAEYNPFHNGHLYQLNTAKAQTEADYTIVVMGGNFMQRGTPAILDKYLRAKMALLCGADLVLELPTYYAASSAEYFAMGGVTLLDKLGVVDHLCFGSECGDIAVLQKIARPLCEEPTEYIELLREYLKKGLSFPTARTNALLTYDTSLSDCKDVFSSPNNILGIEYIKALLRRRSYIEPVTVKRLGADYHDAVLATTKNTISAYTSSSATDAPTSSATAIRNAIIDGTDLFYLKNHMPDAAFHVLEDVLSKSKPVFANDFSALLHYKLLQEQVSGYERFLDVTSELSDRIRNSLYDYRQLEDFCDLLKRKDMTYTRISRCLLHILLNMKTENMEVYRDMDYIPYARVLGFRKESTPLLSAIKANASIPLLTKLADAEGILNEQAYGMLQEDIRINQIYASVLAQKNGGTMTNEYRTPIVIV